MKKQFWFGVLSAVLMLVAIAATPSFQDFSSAQFGVSGNKVAIKSGAAVTNLTVKTALTFDGNTVLTNVVGTLGTAMSGGGAALTTGIKGYFTVAYTGRFTGWSITSDGSSPTCTIDVWRVATGTSLPAVANTIMGTKPALSSGNALRSTTMTGWNSTTFTNGDIFAFNLDAVTSATNIVFVLETLR